MKFVLVDDCYLNGKSVGFEYDDVHFIIGLDNGNIVDITMVIDEEVYLEWNIDRFATEIILKEFNDQRELLSTLSDIFYERHYYIVEDNLYDKVTVNYSQYNYLELVEMVVNAVIKGFNVSKIKRARA